MDVISVSFEQSFLQKHYYEIQFAAVFGGMFVLLLIESFTPRRKTTTDQLGRWLNNISLALINYIVLLFYMFFLVETLSSFKPESPLLKVFELTDFGAFFLVLIIYEFMVYWIHRAFHYFPILWRIHAVHHTDTEIDVTTSQRNHPFEGILSSLIVTPVVIILGAPALILVLLYFIQVAVSLISHSNISIPNRLDNVLRRFIVTPDFHRMHHLSDKQFTDSNYGVVVPWFDYLFKSATYLPYDQLPKMELGIEVLRKPEDSRIDKLLITPFTYPH